MNASKSPLLPVQPVAEGQPLAQATPPLSPLGAPRRRSNHTRHPGTGKFIKGSRGRFGS